MFNFFNSDEPTLAVDLGTRNILVSDAQRVLYRQQNVAASSLKESTAPKKYIVGDLAEELYDKNPGHYKIIKPLSKGVICDFQNCGEILNYALKSVAISRFKKPSVLVSVPLDVTSVERDVFREVILGLGFRNVTLVAEPMAAAVGLVKNFSRKKGVLVVDVGAGISEAVMFSMGGVVCNASVRCGGEDFEAEIKSYIRKHYDFEIGNRAAQYLLDILAADHPDSYLQSIEVKGFDLHRRAPATLNVELHAIHACLDHLFKSVVRSVMSVLEKTPEELSAEIIESGIYLTGGASQYKRLIALLEQQTNLCVVPDQQALLGVARGEVALLQNAQLRKELLCA